MKNLSKKYKIGLGLAVFFAVHYLAAFGTHAAGVLLASATLVWPDLGVAPPRTKRGQASKVAGVAAFHLAQDWVKATTDGDGTLYYIGQLPADAVPTGINLNCDALAGCTSASLGLFRLNPDGSITDDAKSDGSSAKALFMSAKDISAGKALGSEQNGLSDLGVANIGSRIWELLGYTEATRKKADDSYVLVLKLTTAGAATGNIAIRASYGQA